MNDTQMREYVSNMYPLRERWKKKVAGMPDAQVAAIFRDHQRDLDKGTRPQAHYVNLPWQELVSREDSQSAARDPHYYDYTGDDPFA